jgi:hypothetical protein
LKVRANDPGRAIEVRIEENCDPFKEKLLLKASRMPKTWAREEIRQWVLDAARDEPPLMGRMDADRMRRYQMAKQVYGL